MLPDIANLAAIEPPLSGQEPDPCRCRHLHLPSVKLAMMHGTQHNALLHFGSDCFHRMSCRFAQFKCLCGWLAMVEMKSFTAATDCTAVVLPDPAYPTLLRLKDAKSGIQSQCSRMSWCHVHSSPPLMLPAGTGRPASPRMFFHAACNWAM